MPLRLQQPVFLSLLSRLFRFPPSVRLLPLYHSRNVEIRFFPPVKFRSQLIPPVHEKMLRPFLVSEGGHWTLSKDGSSLERNVEFSNFEETKDFIDAVCTEAQRLEHHPEWANVYNRIFIRLKTHRHLDTGAQGISTLDLKLACFCDTEIKKRNGTEPIMPGKGKHLVEELKGRNEAADKEGFLDSQGFQEMSPKEILKSNKRTEFELGGSTLGENSEVRIDEPVITSAWEEATPGSGYEGMAEAHEGMAEAHQKMAEEQEGMGEGQEEMAGDQKGVNGQNDFPKGAETDGADTPAPTSRPPAEEELRALRAAQKKRPALSTGGWIFQKGLKFQDYIEPFEAWMRWKESAKKVMQDKGSWSRLIVEARKRGVPVAWATRELREMHMAVHRSSSPSSPMASSDEAEEETPSSSASNVLTEEKAPSSSSPPRSEESTEAEDREDTVSFSMDRLRRISSLLKPNPNKTLNQNSDTRLKGQKKIAYKMGEKSAKQAGKEEYVANVREATRRPKYGMTSWDPRSSEAPGNLDRPPTPGSELSAGDAAHRMQATGGSAKPNKRKGKKRPRTPRKK